MEWVYNWANPATNNAICQPAHQQNSFISLRPGQPSHKHRNFLPSLEFHHTPKLLHPPRHSRLHHPIPRDCLQLNAQPREQFLPQARFCHRFSAQGGHSLLMEWNVLLTPAWTISICTFLIELKVSPVVTTVRRESIAESGLR